MPEIWYDDAAQTKIGGTVNQGRKGLWCHLCKDRRKRGMLLQCDFRDCQYNYHVRCAIKHKIIDNWEKMNAQREQEDAYDCFLFCEPHREKGIQVL